MLVSNAATSVDKLSVVQIKTQHPCLLLSVLLLSAVPDLIQ